MPRFMKPALTSLDRSRLAAPSVSPNVPTALAVPLRTGDSVKTPMVPPNASLPYCVEAGPRTISMRSRPAPGSHAMYWLGPSRHAAVL